MLLPPQCVEKTYYKAVCGCHMAWPEALHAMAGTAMGFVCVYSIA